MLGPPDPWPDPCCALRHPGKIDPKKLVAFLKELEVQGSLIEGVTVPQDVDEAQARRREGEGGGASGRGCLRR